jgi:alpha-beta hydrolase superfamily lysophospholipase
MRHLEGSFTGKGNLNLYYQCWLPDNEPKAILLVVHGLGDHCGRYLNLVNPLLLRGYGIYAFDMRGHGKSEGLGGYVERFSHFVDDLDFFHRLVRGLHPKAKIFIFGHSAGGTVATAYTIFRRQDFDGLILSGALLSPPDDVPALTIFAARVLSLILPKAGLYYINAEGISQDKNVVKAYQTDPLVYQGKVRARLGIEVIKTMAMIQRRKSDIRLPILILHGSTDKLSDFRNSELLFQEANSADKTLKVYPGFYHEIINEPGRRQVLDDIEDWLKAHS